MVKFGSVPLYSEICVFAESVNEPPIITSKITIRTLATKSHNAAKVDNEADGAFKRHCGKCEGFYQ